MFDCGGGDKSVRKTNIRFPAILPEAESSSLSCGVTVAVPISADNRNLVPYVAEVAVNWSATFHDSKWRQIDGTLLFVDISGFTRLSERLADRGKIGAEELTHVLDRVFGEMLDVVSTRRGSLLKFGGDALLLMFDSDDQRCRPAHQPSRCVLFFDQVRENTLR